MMIKIHLKNGDRETTKKKLWIVLKAENEKKYAGKTFKKIGKNWITNCGVTYIMFVY